MHKTDSFSDTSSAHGGVIPSDSTLQNPSDMVKGDPINGSSESFSPKTAEKTAVPGTLWTWSHSKIKKVRYNKRVAEWMEYDPEFANWVKACLMLHAENGLFESKCLIPDQWKDDVGRRITIVTADTLGNGRGGERLRPESGVFHVLA